MIHRANLLVALPQDAHIFASGKLTGHEPIGFLTLGLVCLFVSALNLLVAQRGRTRGGGKIGAVDRRIMRWWWGLCVGVLGVAALVVAITGRI